MKPHLCCCRVVDDILKMKGRKLPCRGGCRLLLQVFAPCCLVSNATVSRCLHLKIANVGTILRSNGQVVEEENRKGEQRT